MLDTAQVVLRASEIGKLIGTLQHRGFAVLGPTVRDGAILYSELESAADLPAGWSDEQGPGRYRLTRRDTPAYFANGLGPQSWKKYLHPADVRLLAAERSNGNFRILNNEEHPHPPFAFLGVRACELAAIARQDQVLLGGPYRDAVYARQREGLFLIAKQCTASGPTCFCASMGTGPRLDRGFDLALTELTAGGEHRFLARAGSAAGEEVLAELQALPATRAELEAADAAVEKAASSQVRSIDAAKTHDVLSGAFDDPHWEKVAARCLACGNCTMVCPTCFCTTVEDTSDVTGGHAERWRRWDSCFTLNFSYIHGGHVRTSPKARYRQWMTHKLAAWIDQFGAHGCVGCGRCISWCPTGIDITAEFRALQENSHHGNA